MSDAQYLFTHIIPACREKGHIPGFWVLFRLVGGFSVWGEGCRLGRVQGWFFWVCTKAMRNPKREGSPHSIPKQETHPPSLQTLLKPEPQAIILSETPNSLNSTSCKSLEPCCMDCAKSMQFHFGSGNSGIL